ncbi:Ger(x)C family spore germination protein [Bacillota bacterium LX-D]|nr:Ger(x)C family spore germination protein [Bacillota bacterium LX-D]
MRIISLILLVLFLLFSLTGCWNAREINELAFVLSIALDKTNNGFKVTAQVAQPETYSKTPSGGTTSSGKEKPFWIISSTGKTIFEAVRNMAATAPRRILWSHIKVIIIGEKLARSNILEIFDFFSRNPELRLRTWIAVTPGEAGKILAVVPIMEKDPSQNIEKIIDKTNLTGKAYGIMLKNFLEDYLDPYVNPAASRIVLTTEESKPVVKLEGASIFGENKLVGWLDGNKTRGLLWIKNKISGSVRVVNCPYDGLPVTLEIKKGKTNIQSYIDNGQPYFIIKVSASADLTEKSCLTEFTNPKALQSLEKALALAIHNDIQSTVTAAQDFNVDFLDFSSTLHRQHKNEWPQLSANWPQLFKNAEVAIEVKAEIPRVSLLAKSVSPIKYPAENPR